MNASIEEILNSLAITKDNSSYKEKYENVSNLLIKKEQEYEQRQTAVKLQNRLDDLEKKINSKATLDEVVKLLPNSVNFWPFSLRDKRPMYGYECNGNYTGTGEYDRYGDYIDYDDHC